MNSSFSLSDCEYDVTGCLWAPDFTIIDYTFELWASVRSSYFHCFHQSIFITVTSRQKLRFLKMRCNIPTEVVRMGEKGRCHEGQGKEWDILLQYVTASSILEVMNIAEETENWLMKQLIKPIAENTSRMWDLLYWSF